MIINDLLEKENMSRYRLSKESGVAMTTITDVLLRHLRATLAIM